MSAALRAARAAMRGLQAVSPRAAGALADRLFCTPPRWRPSRAHHEFIATGRRFDVHAEGQRVAAWQWGAGPVVLLAHGWGSRGMRFRGLTQALVDAGYSAVVFDAPGHGMSAGSTSSMVQFARAVRAVADRVGPLHALIGHSLGGAASALALRRGLEAERAVFIAPPRNPASYLDDFVATLDVAPEAVRVMRERISRRLSVSWEELDVPSMGRHIDVPLLVVHDRADPTVPYEEGASIAAGWRGAVIEATEGLGHHAIVNHPEVVARVLAHLNGGVAAATRAAWLDRELFERDRRQRSRHTAAAGAAGNASS